MAGSDKIKIRANRAGTQAVYSHSMVAGGLLVMS